MDPGSARGTGTRGTMAGQALRGGERRGGGEGRGAGKCTSRHEKGLGIFCHKSKNCRTDYYRPHDNVLHWVCIALAALCQFDARKGAEGDDGGEREQDGNDDQVENDITIAHSRWDKSWELQSGVICP